MRVFSSLANPEYETTAFTDFGSVNRRTNLASLNLNWRECDLPERERTKHVHRLHPYLGKFVPQLVEIFLRKFAPQRVYDPFCGSGTTLVEASSLGIDSVGCDVSEFNCLVARAKTFHYNLCKMELELRDALQQLELGATPNLFNSNAELQSNNEYLRQWFHPDALRSLLIYRELIRHHTYRDLAMVILSRAARSARLTPHHNLDFPKKPQTESYECRKHDRICSPTANSLQFLRRYTLDTIRRVKEFANLRTNAKVEVICDDARVAALPKFDLIMTSPPYVGLIDYHEQHRYAYELLGLSRNDEIEIGAAFKGKSAAAHKDYMQGIKQVFANGKQFLKKGGVAVIVIGDRENLYTDEFAAELDFEVIQRLRRHVNRRTGRRNTDFFEDVLIWRAR